MNTQYSIKHPLGVQGAFLFLFFILQLVACPLRGQALQLKQLAVSDYPEWGELALKKMSEDGQWLSYAMNYHSGLDTLFIKNAKTSQAHFIPKANASEFIGSDWLLARASSELHILNLISGNRETIKDLIQYSYSSKLKLLIVLHKKNSRNELLIRTLDGKIRHISDGVSEYELSPQEQTVLFTAAAGFESSVMLLELSGNMKKTVLAKEAGTFKNLVWSKKSAGPCAFLHKPQIGSGTSNSILFYSSTEKKLLRTDGPPKNHFLADSLEITDASYRLQISDDGKRIFFMVQKRAKTDGPKAESDVQLWNGNAKIIYPQMQKQKKSSAGYLAMWEPLQDRYLLISNGSHPQFMLNGDQKYAILSNTAKYEPNYGINGLTDYTITDLETGASKVILKKHSAHFQNAVPSPAGKYMAYFKDRNWWAYDIGKGIHINLTKTGDGSFFQNKKEYPDNEDPYPQIGWTADDQEILLYDTYDIWAFNPEKNASRKLTRGREEKMQYRLCEDNAKAIRGRANYSGWMLDPVDLAGGIPLFGLNENMLTGYYWLSKGGISTIAQSDSSRLDQLIASKKGSAAAFREQRYDLPPRIMLKNSHSHSAKILAESNSQQKLFHWGKSELIEYQNSKGKTLKGILYYPAGYTPNRKYPMIVYIYEKLSEYLHRYIIPSEYTGDGSFNITTFTTQGYFVLAPDISYEIGDPGLSAVDCVVSAAQEVISKGAVNPDKLGLIGHSFGGYESDFIITQTNLFAAAVAGSSITDLTSFYLSAGTSSGRPEVWRMESQQWRMGKPLFEDRAAYRRNSPVEHVQNVRTPLFSWTGGSDSQIHWLQSAEFYLALHRQKKKQIMAVYPDEGHTLSRSANQKDLSARIHQWFDFYLKDMPPAAWIQEGIN